MTFLYDADAERGAEWAALFAERAPCRPIILCVCMKECCSPRT